MTLSAYDRANIDHILRDPKLDWFTAKLLRLIADADEHHRELLAKGFPEEVALVTDYKGSYYEGGSI